MLNDRFILRHLVAGAAALLLLTPAYPKAGVDTMAPAVIVAAFQILTQDIDSAQHALKPLVFFSEVAVVIALLLRLLVFRRPRKVTASTAKRPLQS